MLRRISKVFIQPFSDIIKNLQSLIFVEYRAGFAIPADISAVAQFFAIIGQGAGKTLRFSSTFRTVNRTVLAVVAEKHTGAERLAAKGAFRQSLFQAWFGTVEFSVFLKTAIANLAANSTAGQCFIQTTLTAEYLISGFYI